MVRILIIVGVIVVVGVAGYFIFSNTQISPGAVTQETIAPDNVSNSAEEIIPPSLAIYGYKEPKGPIVPAGDLDVSNDCLSGTLTEDDEDFCSIGDQSNVVEVYFEVPENINTEDILEATVNLNLLCSSGLNLFSLTEFGQWVRFGKDLPPSDYKPDGSHGYLSCTYGAVERRTISLPIDIYDSRAGVRIVKGEVTATALIDKTALSITYLAE